MKQSDSKEFCSIMVGLTENFGGKLTENGLLLKFEALKCYSLMEIKEAAVVLVKEKKINRMPNVAEFIDVIEAKDEDLAELEASNILKMVRSLGAYRCPIHKDPVTRELFTSRFLWREVCALTSKELTWFIKEFKSAYLTAKRLKTKKMIGGIDKSVTKLIDRIG